MPQLKIPAFAAGAIIALSPLIASDASDSGFWPVGLAFILGLCALIYHARHEVSWHWQHALWLGLLVWAYVASLATTIYAASEFWLALLRWGGFAAAWIVAVASWKKASARDLLLSGLAGYGGMLSLAYLLSFAAQMGDALGDPYLVPGLMAHKNFTVSAIAMTLPAAFLFLKEVKWMRWVLAGAILAIALAQTRSIWLGLMLSSFLFIQTSWRKSFGWIAVIGLFVAAGLLAYQPARERLLDPANLGIRQVFWSHSGAMIQEAPITGVGLGQWRVHFPKHGLINMNPEVAIGQVAEVRPHNDFIWTLAELGVIGGGMYIAFIMGLWWLWWRDRGQRDQDLHRAIGLGLILFTVYSQFEFPLERSAAMIPFLLMMGALLADKPGRKLPGLYGVTLVFLMGSFVGAYAGYAADRENVAVHQYNDMGPSAWQNLLSASSDAEGTFNQMDRVGNPLKYFQGLATTVQAASSGGNFTGAEALFRQALEIHPWHVPTLAQMGHIHRYQERWSDAQDWYEQLLEVSPTHSEGQYYLALTLVAQGQGEAAARRLINNRFQPAAGQSSDEFMRVVSVALRNTPSNTSHDGLRRILASRDISTMGDAELMQYFLQARAQLQREGIQRRSSTGQ